MSESERERLPTEAQLALQAGRKADAIRIVREQTDLGPAEAAALVEHSEREDVGLDAPRHVQGQEDRGTVRLLVIIAVLAAIAAAIFYSNSTIG